MGKKYIVEIGRLERLYKAFAGAHGKPSLTWLSPEVDLTPYTEPEPHAEVTADAYQRGYETAKHECEDCPKQAYTDALKMESYQKGLNDAWETARTLWNTAKRKEIFGYTVFSTALMTLTGQEAIDKIRQYEQEKEEDGLRQNIQTIVDQCGYSLDEIAEVLEKMKES